MLPYLPSKHHLNVGQGIQGTVPAIGLLGLPGGVDHGDGVLFDDPVGVPVCLPLTPLIDNELLHEVKLIASVTPEAVKEDDGGLVLELGPDL